MFLDVERVLERNLINMKINNKKILESKKIIQEERRKIKCERRNIRKKRWERFEKTKFGKVVKQIFFIFDLKRDRYSFSQLFAMTLFSLAIGFLACYSVFAILVGNRNLFKLSKELSKFYDVYDVLVDNYYGEIDQEELIDEAISGMVSSVGDVYTNYADTETTDSFNELVNGTYEGIGCTILQGQENISVLEVYDDSPAFKAGILVGDIIKEVDGQEAFELGSLQLSNYIKNEASEKIEMVIIRDDELKNVTLKRGHVEVPAVSGKVIDVLDKKIGYIDISIFSSVSADQFTKKLEELEKEDIAGLVIDVRDNNGGYLTAVTDIASSLLPKGKKIYQIQNDEKKKVYKDKTNEKREYPIAILTNSASASASEILAGVIKESYGGFVVGTKTYGKGTVQQVKKLSDGSMIKYTVENWLTPDGNWIDGVGIKPTDEVVLNNEYYKTYALEDDNQLQKALELVSK